MGAIIEMYPAGVSARRIEDVSGILWGAGISAGTVSNLNEKVLESVDAWRTRPLSGGYPYLFVDGVYLKRSWGGSYENVAVMVAIGVNSEGRREIAGCAEGFTVRFYRNVFGKVPRQKRTRVAKMLKAVHAQESREASEAKASEVADSLGSMKLFAAAKVVRGGCAEALACTDFPMQHWTRVRASNAIGRLNRETRRRTRVVGTFPDGKSALMLVTARLRCIVENEWGRRRYLVVSLLEEKEGGM